MSRIDLVCLDEAGPVLCFEAVHANCLLYTTPDFHHAGYFTRIPREYFDFEPYLRSQPAGVCRSRASARPYPLNRTVPGANGHFERADLPSSLVRWNPLPTRLRSGPTTGTGVIGLN